MIETVFAVILIFLFWLLMYSVEAKEGENKLFDWLINQIGKSKEK
jgi:uncharacterized membrane protein